MQLLCFFEMNSTLSPTNFTYIVVKKYIFSIVYLYNIHIVPIYYTILCRYLPNYRRQILERQRKETEHLPTPYLVSDPSTGYRESPIVKSYQRVPAAAWEFLHSDQCRATETHTAAMEPEKPLLA